MDDGARHGIRVASVTPVLSLVAVSGAECVDALVVAGFTVRSRSDSATVLGQGVRVVVVPDVAMLTPDDLYALLRDAGIAYERLLDLLAETPTDVQRPAAARRPRAS